MRKPASHFDKIWWLVTALAVAGTLPLQIIWPAYSTIAMWIVIVGLGIFAVAEFLGTDAQREYTGYYTGWWYFKVRNDKVRWAAGVWLAFVVLLRLPSPWSYIFGIGLFAWLPMHYATTKFEKRFAASLGGVPAARIAFLLWLSIVAVQIVLEAL